MLPPHRRAFSSEWQRSIEHADKLMEEYQEEDVDQYYDQHTRSLPEIHIGLNVAIHNRDTKCWDICDRI